MRTRCGDRGPLALSCRAPAAGKKKEYRSQSKEPTHGPETNAMTDAD